MPDGQQTPIVRTRKSRGLGLRKTTGCLTCRRRHIKCDEGKPECRGCLKSKQICIYGPPAVRNVVASSNVKSSGSSESSSRSIEVTTAPNLIEIRNPTFNAEALPLWQHSTISDGHSRLISTGSAMSPSIGATVASPDTPRVDPLLQVSYHNHDKASSSYHDTNESMATASIASSAGNIESATAEWFGLLFGDAVLENSNLPDLNFESDGFDLFGNSIVQSPVQTPEEDATPRDINGPAASPFSQTSNLGLLERVPRLGGDQLFEKQAWHSSEPIELLSREHFLFQHFVQHISQWIDLFDPKRSFSTFLPHLAMHNVGLMNAILALSVRHLSLNVVSNTTQDSHSPDDAIQYYYKTLRYIQKAMDYNTYKTSLELLSTALIISTYEMLDGSNKNWEGHLKGVFWIQRSQIIHGDSKGLRQAVWWAWLCQDVWAAFREKRKPFTFWKPVRSLETMDPYELAARSVYLFAQAVAYCSREEIEKESYDLTSRIRKASELTESLEEWRRHLTIEFEAMPHGGLLSEQQDGKDTFEPLWIHPPAIAVAVQLYYCSRILLLINKPVMGGFKSYVVRQRELANFIKVVVGIAMTLTDYASSIMCSQCLFIAGLPLEDRKNRETVLKLLRECRQRTGWPVQRLDEELTYTWNGSHTV